MQVTSGLHMCKPVYAPAHMQSYTHTHNKETVQKKAMGVGGCQAEVKRLKAWGMGKGLAPPFQCLETPKEPGMVAKDCNPSI